MSTNLVLLMSFAIDINGHTITIVPSQQFITCNIEQALGWQMERLVPRSCRLALVSH